MAATRTRTVEPAPSPATLARLGFVASVLSLDLTTSRTCRLRTATPARMRELIAQNLDELDNVFSFLGEHDIRLYRISSNVVPFGSHPVNTLRWGEDFGSDLRALGARARALGVRVSMHPGQFTVLNSPSATVVTSAIAELVYHARLLDAMEMDRSCKLVIHVGGLYGGSEAEALNRFAEVASSLPETVLQRLVVENDDRLFDAAQASRVANRVGIPVVFDWLHHLANPCEAPLDEVLPAILDTWRPADGRPKVHLSSQAKGKAVGAHADFVAANDFLAFLAAVPSGRTFDCMLEAKQKDKALLRLREDLRALGVEEADAAGHRLADRGGGAHEEMSWARGAGR
jgi:UV DNA damage endonuclease